MLDFERDVRELALATLQTSEAGRQELQQMSVTDLLVRYLNWRKRQVEPAPRLVHRSQVLVSRMRTLEPAHLACLTQLLTDLEQGVDVSAHLSIGSQVGYLAKNAVQRSKPLSRRTDLDLLLNDWGIHHFHLGRRTAGKRFGERTGPLLFAVVRATDVYAIDVLGHGSWANQHLIEVLVREWPSEDVVHSLNLLGAERQLSEADRLRLRNGGMSAPVTVDGRVYMPNLGIATSGVSTLTTAVAMRVVRSLRWLEDELARDPSYVHRIMIRNAMIPRRELDLHFEFFEQGRYGVVERQSGFRLVLP